MVNCSQLLRPLLTNKILVDSCRVNQVIRFTSRRSYCHNNNNSEQHGYQQYGLKRNQIKRILIASSLSVTTIGLIVHRNKLKAKVNEIPGKEFEAGNRLDGLKEFTKDEVNLHNNLDKGIWIIYRNGVYDITRFVEQHPGGDKILLGAGQDIEPFWNLYAVHKHPDVFKLLESHRIGNLCPEDVNKDAVDQSNDPYQDDPKRPGYFSVRSAKPFNAEPPLNILSDSWITPK